LPAEKSESRLPLKKRLLDILFFFGDTIFMLTAAQIRKSFIDFFVEKRHTFVPSSPVVPVGDDTLLFANAGMNQFKDMFLGTGSRGYNRAVNSQKCIRAGGKHNDLEDVGTDTYHHTFFEMLGNWSFGDYFKAEAIEWAWELITKRWDIPSDKLYATVFAGDKGCGLDLDKEAALLWPKVTGLPKERVLSFGRKDNFWEMGDTGPCGPCSEIHIDLGPDRCDKKNVPGHKCAVNAGCGRFIELWNLVFIQYNRLEEGSVLPLPAKHVDTGMGLERITAVLQNKNSNYDTDIFSPILDTISQMTGKKYAGTLNGKTDIAFRVVSDHLRALVFAITDGGMPSNEGRGYVLRRILRRAARFGRQLGIHEPFIYKLVDVIVDSMTQVFEELAQRAELVKTVIKSEEESFGRTLDRGLEIFTAAAKKAKAGGVINGADVFELYDTYGFPLDLTQLMAREKNLKVDTEGFDELMEQQRQRARAAQKTSCFASVVTDTKLPATQDSAKYSDEKTAAEILGWIDGKGFHTKGGIPDGQTAVVLDRTCFYAQSGGQTGDAGRIVGPKGSFLVEAAERIADCVLHRGKIEKGTVTIGDKVEAIVDVARRESKKNHTATHLLQWALQQVLGRSVAQQGSLVCSEYLRFDFTSPRALKLQEVEEVERLVNEKITAAIPVTSVILPIKEAKKLGAMALFGEKYGDAVRVIAVGAPDENNLAQAFSKEFCGGTHVSNTAIIGGFKIIKEESIAAGVRRITALTGKGLAEYYSKISEIVEKLSQILEVPAEQICERVDRIVEDNKNLGKQLKNASKQSGTDCLSRARQLLENCEKIGSSSIVAGVLESAPIEEVRQAIDMIKKKAGSAAVVFGQTSGDKVTLLAGVTDDLIQRGLKAGDIVKEIAPIVDGSGGGKPQMAQAGGKKCENLPQALQKAVEFIKQKLV
jgi:alanyl-tRNA synthetase